MGVSFQRSHDITIETPPSAVYDMPEVFGALDKLVQDGKLRHYGVSVERIDEALAALKFPNVQSVQIIYNLFRQRPAEVFLPAAQAAQVDENVSAADLAALPATLMQALADVYQRRIAPQVHGLW